MKRSRTLRLTVMAVALPLAIGACSEDEQPRELVVENVDQCVSAAQGTRAECEQAFNAAWGEHERTAPKYQTADTCRALHDNCEEHRDAQGHSIFMPMMAGLAVGYLARGFNGQQPVDCQATPNAQGCRSSASGARGFVSTRPLYRSRGGTFTAGDGSVYGNRSGVSAPARASTVARGGFGAHGSGRGG